MKVTDVGRRASLRRDISVNASAPSPNRRRTWIWVCVLLGAFGIIGAVIVSFAVRALDTPFGKGFEKGFVGALTGDTERNKTPGEKAVAKAGKCQTATVVSGESAAQNLDSGVKLDLDFVVCILPIAGSTTPSCDDMAQAFVVAASPTRRFMVITKRLLGGDEIICQRTYSKTGKMITDHLEK